jgi:hypothetical protein
MHLVDVSRKICERLRVGLGFPSRVLPAGLIRDAAINHLEFEDTIMLLTRFLHKRIELGVEDIGSLRL